MATVQATNHQWALAYFQDLREYLKRVRRDADSDIEKQELDKAIDYHIYAIIHLRKHGKEAGLSNHTAHIRKTRDGGMAVRS